MKQMKVMPWGKDQGDYVVINAEDFDPKVHKAYGEQAASTEGGEKPLDEMSAAELKELATAKGLEFPGNVSKAKLLDMLNTAAA
ncbi:hypothetical protein [Caldimonas sp. KR1-144]|uniref:hypothetical protein n=1 Tax=Caldimonas sp. KR1-144 TaxID=3400911 RepID=UPI003C10758B